MMGSNPSCGTRTQVFSCTCGNLWNLQTLSKSCPVQRTGPKGSIYQLSKLSCPNTSRRLLKGVLTGSATGRTLKYVGMSGRGITTSTIPRNSPHGLYTRLHTHWGGRRSGDQFCVYVADRFVLPTLSQEDIASIASGRERDALVRRYIHDELLYRYIAVLVYCVGHSGRSFRC